ncbi:hypothetical protein DICVIV_12851 [Dictyocaulus viviparus]|uniref:guanylate cyclase n=1 Tax=Dictyocaulus viviparus TaxID=29172 RepID=A0A0D8XC15_DICVI|nr:hypothetical protein DICVIV_12851 [Dictyocaulus viviparus]
MQAYFFAIAVPSPSSGITKRTWDNGRHHRTDEAAAYAGQLHDSLYTYARALNKTLQQDPNAYRNGKKILENVEMTFEGMSGLVKMSSRGMRSPTFYLDGIDVFGKQEQYGVIEVDGDIGIYKPLYTNETLLWWTRGGIRPRDEPLCGFTGKQRLRIVRVGDVDECPKQFFEENLAWIVAVIVIMALIILASILSIREQIENLNSLWQIPFSALESITSEKSKVSQRSLQSGTSSALNKIDIEALTATRNYEFFFYQRECVAALKHEALAKLAPLDPNEIRQVMRELDNDNLNHFVGLCLDTSQLLSLWKFCGRGSLHDVIMKGSMMMDSYFVFALLRDVVDGLHYIHRSFLQYHGFLTSKCCLVDQHWQVKISSYGLQAVRRSDKRLPEDLLWTAPEILRKNDMNGSKEGDIYRNGFHISAESAVVHAGSNRLQLLIQAYKAQYCG